MNAQRWSESLSCGEEGSTNQFTRCTRPVWEKHSPSTTGTHRALRSTRATGTDTRTDSMHREGSSGTTGLGRIRMTLTTGTHRRSPTKGNVSPIGMIGRRKVGASLPNATKPQPCRLGLLARPSPLDCEFSVVTHERGGWFRRPVRRPSVIQTHPVFGNFPRQVVVRTTR